MKKRRRNESKSLIYCESIVFLFRARGGGVKVSCETEETLRREAARTLSPKCNLSSGSRSRNPEKHGVADIRLKFGVYIMQQPLQLRSLHCALSGLCLSSGSIV